MASTADKAALTPAYGSFKTFNSFMDTRREDGHVTDVVDRSLMTKFAGSTAGELLTGLKYLGFITDKGAPTTMYADYVTADDEARKPLLDNAIRAAYPYLFNTEGFNIERATSQQMADQFRAQGINGSTLARAVIFFLAAAKQAGIKVSPNIKAPPMSAGPAKKPKKEAPNNAAPNPSAANSPPITALKPTDGVHVFDIPIPINRKVSIAVPLNFVDADWEFFKTMLGTYIDHWKVQTAMMQKQTAAAKEDERAE